ncbi:MAG TPA: DUF1592 domain-containing protein [Planctomycetota bacterium]|nr:DUF1592 domain-containing protein [Planctomycetota bacterium]
MKRFGSLLLFMLSSVAFSACAGDARPAPKDPKEILARYDKEIKPLLSTHCFKCHGNGKKKGNVNLDDALSIDSIQKNTNKWLAVLEQVRTGSMPPEEVQAVDKKNVELIVRWLGEAIATADHLRPRDPGFVSLHRLNRTEYNNTIRDLTGVDFRPADDFPADDSGYGFDNIADVLTMSPLLAEKYIGAAESIVERVIKMETSKTPTPLSGLIGEAKRAQTVGQDDSGLIFSNNGDATMMPHTQPGSEYTLKIKASQAPAGTEPAKMLVKVDGVDVLNQGVDAPKDKPKEFTAKFRAKGESAKVVVMFTNEFREAEPQKNGRRRSRRLFVHAVELEGPPGAPKEEKNRKKVFIAMPSKELTEEACAEKILKNFATRAFRRPVKDDELKSLLKIYSNVRKDAPSFEKAVGSALTAALVSPFFLFRVENKLPFAVPPTPDNPTGAWPLDEYEIATRLSYFLWSTMPDDELFMLAGQRMLKNPKIREEQVRRMLKDRRSGQLIENFAGQWLELRNLDEVMRDGKLFPQFDTKLASAMEREATLFFDSIVREDRSIFTLIDADYTFVNGPLAQLYGIPNIKGDEFQKVTLKNSPRGGVVTMGSTLTLTSNPTRTSPVKRGKWVLEQILGTPPPPPPPEVPTLVEKPSDEAGASLRKRLEAHRADPSCAVCHNRMDGLGFALENFDSIGRWRDSDGKFPVDASGTLPGGDSFKGAIELKAVLMKRREGFARNFVEKMLTFALGRGIKQYDRATVNEILKQVEQNEYKFSSVVMGIVNSDAFLKRREKRGDE